jgi:uncharacterized membrane protein YeaQ/YmgE (transglycosylase-associated protein family)
VLSAVLAALALGFVIGGLGRFAVPGPDPMPFWLTVLIGLAGSAIGLGIATAIYGSGSQTSSPGRFTVTVLLEIFAASALVIAYRRFVQGRPITGPEAYAFPKKGLGIERMRQRLRAVGVDPDQIGRPGMQPVPQAVATASSNDTDELMRMLSELHRAGVLSDEEYRAKVEQVTRRG